jgi:hypothetical protein
MKVLDISACLLPFSFHSLHHARVREKKTSQLISFFFSDYINGVVKTNQTPLRTNDEIKIVR